MERVDVLFFDWSKAALHNGDESTNIAIINHLSSKLGLPWLTPGKVGIDKVEGGNAVMIYDGKSPDYEPGNNITLRLNPKKTKVMIDVAGRTVEYDMKGDNVYTKGYPLYVNFDMLNEFAVRMLVTAVNSEGISNKTAIQTFTKPPTERAAWDKLTSYIKVINDNRRLNHQPEITYAPDELKVIMNVELARITEVHGIKQAERKERNEKYQQHQQQEQQYAESEDTATSSGIKNYIVKDGNIYKVKMVADSEVTEWLCNFYFEFTKDAHLDDGIIVVRMYEGIIHCNGKPFDFKAEAATFADDKAFEKFFSDKLGSDKRYDVFKVRDIRNVVNNLINPTVEKVTIRKVFGFDGDKYLTPSVVIDKDGVRPNNETPVDLSEVEGARCLDLKEISDEDFDKVGKHILTDFMSLHDPYYMRNLTGYGFIAPAMSKIEDHPKIESFRYVGWAIGLFSIGKSFAAKRVQNFFGTFKNKDIMAFGSTPYTAGIRGYYFKDAFLLWDNYRKNLFGNKHAKTQYEDVINNYADGNSRGRLGDKLVEQKSKWIRGMLFVTGEDIPDDKGGVVSRIHKIQIHKKNSDRVKGRACLDMQHLYPGFMARYIHWLIKSKPVDDIVKLLLDYSSEIIKGIENEGTADRISKSHAVPLTGYHLFLEFMVHSGFMKQEQMDSELADFKNQIMEMRQVALGNVKDASDTEIFIGTVSQILNAKKACTDETKEPNKTAIGFFKTFDERKDLGELFCLRPEVAYMECQKFLKEDDRYISVGLEQLKKLLFEGKDESGNPLIAISGNDADTNKEKATYQARHPVTGNRERVLVFRKSTFGFDELRYTGDVFNMDAVATITLPAILKDMNIAQNPTLAQYKEILRRLVYVHAENSPKGVQDRFRADVKPIVKACIIVKGWILPEGAN